jgi:hypothetical protein
LCAYFINQFFVYSFVYGEVKDFKSTNFAIKLNEFALEMQINSLTQALEEFFKTAEITEIFAFFDYFCATGNQAGLDNCKMVSNFFLIAYY